MSRKHLLNHCDTFLLFCFIATVHVVSGIDEGPGLSKGGKSKAICGVNTVKCNPGK